MIGSDRVTARARPEASLEALRLQRGAEHLHRLGPRAIAELLAEIGRCHGCGDDVLRLVAQFHERLTPEMMRITGGDKFPRRPLLAVPA